MTRCTGALLLLLTLSGGGLLWAGQKPPAPSPPPQPPGASGQGELALLNRHGKPAGTCPLRHTDVVADVAAGMARVNVRQQFHNPSREPVEAVYTFPLPDDAAVDQMSLQVGSRTIRGEVKRREEAR